MGTKRLTTRDLEWTPFERGFTITDAKGNVAQLGAGIRSYSNSRYQVWYKEVECPPPFGKGIHLSIKSHDRKPIHDWRDLQRIKNEIVGPEVEAVELYPRDSRVVDVSNQFHLFCFPDYEFPFGQTFREVLDKGNLQDFSNNPVLSKAEQRPLDKSDTIHSKTTMYRDRVPPGHRSL